jgi:cell wall assembly regulator SMI1
MSKSNERTESSVADNRPVDVIRDGNLKASIWRNEGENSVSFATTIARTYKTEDGAYRESNSFTGTELLRVSELARKAYDRTNDLRRDDYEQGSSQSRESPARGEDHGRDGEVNHAAERGGRR